MSSAEHSIGATVMRNEVKCSVLRAIKLNLFVSVHLVFRMITLFAVVFQFGPCNKSESPSPNRCQYKKQYQKKQEVVEKLLPLKQLNNYFTHVQCVDARAANLHDA